MDDFLCFFLFLFLIKLPIIVVVYKVVCKISKTRAINNVFKLCIVFDKVQKTQQKTIRHAEIKTKCFYEGTIGLKQLCRSSSQ